MFDIEERDDRTRSFMNDRGDLLQRVLVTEAQPDERDLCTGASTDRPDLTHVRVAPDDLMAERLDDRRDVVESLVLFVGDQHL
jgi:hypothetical protein